ncbi:hypothetical protein [Paludisphaera rhizosphaerae]|uniref:hypothetical protein n=1 Tax=Paludisphaera rhizosphaerae TaxID=2711216 RepID=UPI001C6F4984|nr:hypothetical protein [Paludisphaera rhizosphaerae]
MGRNLHCVDKVSERPPRGGTTDVGDKNRFSRWRRLPPVFRSGSREHKLPGFEEEIQRLTLYLPGSYLDLAELLAGLEQIPTIQEYCSRLLVQALEEERTRRQVTEVEEKRGSPLSGLDEIADDPNYLAEWNRRREDGRPASSSRPDDADAENLPALTVPLVHIPAIETDDALLSEPTPPAEAPQTVRLEIGPRSEPEVAGSYEPEIPDGRAMDIVWKHVGEGGGDLDGFLAHLRRGEQVPPASTAELLAALRILEEENRGSAGLDRRLAYALYRLALESQVLLTEAWPGAFDDATVAAIRAVQDKVERILSGAEAAPSGQERGEGE